MSEGRPVLTVWDSNGVSHELVVRGPGGTVRVCVGERHGAHSTVWRIWSPPKHNDIYIAARDIADYQKWSLHQSGDWRHQWVTERHAFHVTRNSERIIDRWTRPAPLEKFGWTKAFYIRVRLADCADYGDGDQLPKDIVWVSPPPEGQAAIIHVVISDADRIVQEVGGLIPLHAYTLANGQAVLLLASLQSILPEEEDELAAIVRGVADDPRVLRAVAPRMTVSIVNEEDGDRGVWDVAISRSDY